MTQVQSPDGLPVVEPTKSLVLDTIETVPENAEDVIGEIPPHFNQATVRTVAVNAVMAGCAPSYFPVVKTALEATLEEQFNLYGMLATTHPCWPSIVVNGPVIDEIGLNGGANAYGQGNRANGTIGRALTFVYMNIGNALPEQGDKAVHGGPHKYGLCVAENEAQNPWDPLHVERGFDLDESTVTVLGTESPHNFIDNVSGTATGILSTAADTMAIAGTNLAYHNEHGEPHLVLSPKHASTIANDGWSKHDAKEFLYDNARVRLGDIRNTGMKGRSRPPRYANEDDLPDDQLIPLGASPDNFIITVTGGTAGPHSLFHPTFGETQSVTKPVDEYSHSTQ